MRRLTSAGLIGLTAAGVLLPALPALAADATLTVDASAWSWRRLAPAGLPAAEPSNVPAGDLSVAFDGRPDAAPAKATYLRLALAGLPAGTAPTNLTLVLPVDPATGQDPAAAQVVACRLRSAFVTGEGVDPSVQPLEDCTGAAPGVYDAAKGTMSFLLTTAAVEWLSGTPNTGVVLRPDPAAAAPAVLPFQVNFTGPATVVARLSATSPAIEVPPSAGPVSGPALPPATVLVPGSGDPVLPALAPAPAAVPVAEAPGVLPAPAVAAVPLSALVAAPTVTPVQVRAARRASEAGLAVATLLGVLLLALVGWTLGADAHPMAFARTERRRADRLRRGQLVVAPVARPQASGQVAQRRQGRRPASSAASTVT